MRSSKSRSRSKSNRTNSNSNNRSGVNIVNRVFDSSGPEGKVRGTPQQIIDKYNQLFRDAQLSNDRVAAENFQQHAEHYLRLLGEAQREIDARRDQEIAQQQQRDQQQQQRDQQQRDRQQNDQQQRDRQQNDRQQNDPNDQQNDQQDNRRNESQQPGGEQPYPRDTSRAEPQKSADVSGESEPAPVQAETPTPRAPRTRSRAPKPAPQHNVDVIETTDGEDRDSESGLVDTPESAPEPAVKKPRRPRTRAKAKTAEDDTPEAAE